MDPGPRFVRAFPTRPPFPPHRARVAGRDGVEQRRAARCGWEVFEREDREGNQRKGGNEEGKGEFAGGLGEGHALFDSGRTQ